MAPQCIDSHTGVSKGRLIHGAIKVKITHFGIYTKSILINNILYIVHYAWASSLNYTSSQTVNDIYIQGQLNQSRTVYNVKQ